MAAHLRGKRVGRIDQVGDGMLVQLAHHTRHATEPTDAHGDGLRSGLVHPAGIRQDRPLAPFGQTLGQRAGFQCAAKDKDVAHG